MSNPAKVDGSFLQELNIICTQQEFEDVVEDIFGTYEHKDQNNRGKSQMGPYYRQYDLDEGESTIILKVVQGGNYVIENLNIPGRGSIIGGEFSGRVGMLLKNLAISKKGTFVGRAGTDLYHITDGKEDRNVCMNIVKMTSGKKSTPKIGAGPTITYPLTEFIQSIDPQTRTQLFAGVPQSDVVEMFTRMGAYIVKLRQSGELPFDEFADYLNQCVSFGVQEPGILYLHNIIHGN